MPAMVVVLERNRRVGERITRIISASINFARVSYVDTPADLRTAVSPATRLLACGENDIQQVAAWFFNIYPQLRFLVWSSGKPGMVIQLAASQTRLSNIIGWPSFQSIPRPWELAMAARRLVLPQTPVPDLTDLLQWGATVVEWAPRTSVERDRVVADVSRIALHSGASAKIAERVSDLAYELLMNAMYDAPVDEYGQPRYAFDRTRDVVLEEAERPVLRLVSDGMMLAIQAIDPFGGLQRRHVIDGIARVLAAQNGDYGRDVVDTSHGGAGLGMGRLYTGSAVLMIDVIRGRATQVSSVHDLNMTGREMRGAPGSLHYFWS